MSQDAAASMAQSRPSHEWVMLTGIGLWILYCPSQLNITWENGSSLIVRLDAATIVAHPSHGQNPGVAELRIGVQMDNPRGANGSCSVMLSFPAEQDPGVQRLAEMLQSLASSDGENAPAAETGFPSHPPATTPEALRPAPKPPVTQPAPVRIDASARHWADDSDWIGLYPPRETERLLADSDRPAQAPEHPQAT